MKRVTFTLSSLSIWLLTTFNAVFPNYASNAIRLKPIKQVSARPLPDHSYLSNIK